MKHFLLASILGLLCWGCDVDHDPLQYVDPMIGTGFHGHTFPGATTPFGMVQLSPDTRLTGWDACAGYHYDDHQIYGFSHTHLSGTGCADLADVLFHPATSIDDFDPQTLDYAPYDFTHNREKASAGYYSVELPSAKLNVELTATPRTGVHRYTFTRKGERLLLIDLKHTITDETITQTRLEQISRNEVVGMRRTDGWVVDQHVYFSMQSSAPIERSIMVGTDRALLVFPRDIDSLILSVGLSCVSEDNARQNRLCEVPVLDFDRVYRQTEELWRSALSDVQVTGHDSKTLTNFYTAQYHSKIAPNLMSDCNGMYRRNDGSIAQLPEGRLYYSTLSLWDTFRTWNPLQTMVNPQLVRDLVWSMMDMYDATGELPMWPLYSGETGTMIGYHAVSVIADAYLRGIVTSDAEHLLKAMVDSSNCNKKGSELYLKYGYIPANMTSQSVSCQLEFAYDDWCIARMAERMGKDSIAQTYYKRAASYVQVFDGNTRFFRGHHLNGDWTTPFEEFATGRDYTEATPWQYRFFVPHDVLGLEALFGGREDFVGELDRLFTLESDAMELDVADVTGLMGQYAHGNEPSHHMAYLYNWVGQPWKTQALTRRLLDQMYEPTPEGIIGNEDCGQMSAWYIMSSMGLYPVCPASGELIVTTPQFEKITLRLASGKTLVINAPDASRKHYVKSLSFRGEKVLRPYLTYEELMEGGTLDFELSSDPIKDVCATQHPYSMTSGQSVAMPFIKESLSLFKEPVSVHLLSNTASASIRYTTDGTEPNEQSPLFDRELRVDRPLTLKAKAYKEGFTPSQTFTIEATPADYLPALNLRIEETGVRYTYYEGQCSSVADICGCKKIETGIMDFPHISDSRSSDHFAYVFEGLIEVPQTDVWEFMTKSDDGSVLFIDGREVVSNDLSHAAISSTGRIALEKGLHRYRILYFEDYEGEYFEWGWRREGQTAFKPIPKENLKISK